MLASVDLIIECRDFRVPVTSRNPLFEQNLAGKERVIVYTKQDLGHEGGKYKDKRKVDSIKSTVQQWHYPEKVLFSNYRDSRSVHLLLNHADDRAKAKVSLLPCRMMIVGMPNVGKSSLLNALRKLSLHRPKAAQTGAQPGVTRKVATAVKILEANSEREGVFVVDTPGVFIPYVPNAESMLKLALCGCVKDTIIPPTILADYLLYHINLYKPDLYAHYNPPTNDISEFLSAMARKTGRLQKGGIPDHEATALWMIQRWRAGHLGKFILDEVSLTKFEEERQSSEATLYASFSQGRKQGEKGRMKTRPLVAD